SATVYRRAAGDDWRAVGSVTSDPAGVLAWNESGLTAGAAFEYRLGVTGGGNERFTVIARVQMPASPAGAPASGRRRRDVRAQSDGRAGDGHRDPAPGHDRGPDRRLRSRW